MTTTEILSLIRRGEGLTIEFKKSTSDITKDVYDTVCSFSNREGGHILLGVTDDGNILDVFRTIVPLTAIAVGRVGPRTETATQDKTQVKPQDRTQVETQDSSLTMQEKILAYCTTPRSKADIVQHFGYSASKSFTRLYLKPLLDSGLLLMTTPDKPTSRNQKYTTVQLG